MDRVNGLRWTTTGGGGGVLWITTTDGRKQRFVLDNFEANVLLRALLANATTRIPRES